MAWRLAKGLEKLRAQVNGAWPTRSKSSDGSIGDVSHSSRLSDHNPTPDGVVDAIDITHDPKSGFDSYAFADVLRKNRDKRVKYIISNRKIAAGVLGPQPWVWRKYTGINPHNHHVHISIRNDLRDDVSEWNIGGMSTDMTAPYAPPLPTLRTGSIGKDVEKLQALLKIKVDGSYGPVTAAAVKALQVKHGLVADGVCGPMTWDALD